MNSVPYDESFEKAVLVSILSDPSLLPRIQQIVSEGDFFKVAHQEIFHVITEIEIDNIDSLTVGDRLSDSTREYFKTLVENTDSVLPSLSNAIIYAETIKSKSKLRRGIDLGREITAICYEQNIDADDAVQKLEDMFAKFLRNRINEKNTTTTRERFETFVDTLADRLNADTGVKTGFRAVDRFLHKLTGLNVLAARPGVGKTAFSIAIARNIAETKPVLFFSLEQTQEQVFERMLAAESGVSHEEIVTGAFFADKESSMRVREAAEILKPVFNNLTVDDKPSLPASYITSVSRQVQFERGEIGLIIVDYLHLMQLDDEQIVQGLGTATKDLRALGKELNCPVLLLSQLSRKEESTGTGENKTHRRPELSDLRGSGEIEQNADVVIFLFRESYFDTSGYTPPEDDVEVIIKKNRNGRTGVDQVVWYPKIFKYSDLR